MTARPIFWRLTAVALFCAFVDATSVKAADWSKTDNALFAGYVALSAYDAAQTDQGIRSGRYHETNPLLGKHPTTARLVVTKVAFGGLVYGLADSYPANRHAILLAADVLELVVVGHNASIGLRVKF